MEHLTWLLVLLYAAADRVWGMERSEAWKKRPLKVLILAALVIVSAGLALIAYGDPMKIALAAGLGAAWMVYRSPGWDIFGGSMDPANLREIAGLFLRQLLAMPCLALPAYWAGASWLTGIYTGAVFAVFATQLGVWLRSEVVKAERADEPLGEQNTVVELLRGGVYGVATVLILAS